MDFEVDLKSCVANCLLWLTNFDQTYATCIAGFKGSLLKGQGILFGEWMCQEVRYDPRLALLPPKSVGFHEVIAAVEARPFVGGEDDEILSERCKASLKLTWPLKMDAWKTWICLCWVILYGFYRGIHHQQTTIWENIFYLFQASDMQIKGFFV